MARGKRRSLPGGKEMSSKRNRDPMHAQLEKAHQHQNANEPDQANACYLQILEQQPGHMEANRSVGVYLQVRNRPEQALAYWERALSAAPNHVPTLFDYGRCLHLLHRYEESMSNFESAFALLQRQGLKLVDEQLADVYYKYGHLCRDMQLDDAEEASFARAIELQPDFVAALFDHGLVLGRMGRAEESKASYRRGLHIEPDSAGSSNARSCLRVRLRNVGRERHRRDISVARSWGRGTAANSTPPQTRRE